MAVRFYPIACFEYLPKSMQGKLRVDEFILEARSKAEHLCK